MSTTNQITVTRNAIKRAIIELKSKLVFETDTLEVDINKDTTIFVEVLNHDHLDYSEIEITGIDVLKDSDKKESYLTCIASYIGTELDKTVKFMNSEERERALTWDYQRDYETIGGKFANLSY